MSTLFPNVRCVACKRLKHIILLQMVEKDDTYTYIATELCDCNVEQWLNKKELHKEVWSKQAAGFVQNILSGLNYMHTLKKPILHKDIKVYI